MYYLPWFKKYQLYILISAGFVFYAFNHLEFLYLLICSALLNAVSSYLTQSSANIKMRKIYALSGVVLNLCLLGFFKYGTLVYHSFFEVSQFGEWLVALPLPIGISFYTFQGISLLVDVLKNEKNIIAIREKNFMKHIVHILFFISFFHIR
jgi:alginate O-acetyltransferase complex protein AlgI